MKKIRFKSLADRLKSTMEKILLTNKKIDDLCREQKEYFEEFDRLNEIQRQKTDIILKKYQKKEDIRRKVFIMHYLKEIPLVDIAVELDYSYKYIKNINRKIASDLKRIDEN